MTNALQHEGREGQLSCGAAVATFATTTAIKTRTTQAQQQQQCRHSSLLNGPEMRCANTVAVASAASPSSSLSLSFSLPLSLPACQALLVAPASVPCAHPGFSCCVCKQTLPGSEMRSDVNARAIGHLSTPHCHPSSLALPRPLPPGTASLCPAAR